MSTKMNLFGTFFALLSFSQKKVYVYRPFRDGIDYFIDWITTFLRNCLC